MTDDWTVLTDERRTELVSTLRKRRNDYLDTERALRIYVADVTLSLTNDNDEVIEVIKDWPENILDESVSNNTKRTLMTQAIEKLEKLSEAIHSDTIVDSEVVGKEPDGSYMIHFTEDEAAATAEGVRIMLAAHNLRPRLRNEMALVYGVALYEGFISDILQIALEANPVALRSSRRQISYADALKYADRGSLIKALARRDVVELTHDHHTKMTRDIGDKFNIKLDDGIAANVPTLLLALSRRNLIVHNNGNVTTEHADLEGAIAAIGSQLDITDDTLTESLDAIRSIANITVDLFISKYKV